MIALLTSKIFLLIILVVISFTIIFSKNILYDIAFLSVFSLSMSLIYLILDAPDVAITEAAVGSCISTIFILWTLLIIKDKTHVNSGIIKNWGLPLIFVTLTGLLLSSAVQDLPTFASPSSPSHGLAYKYYVTNTYELTEIPNLVTAILASFRGFDTFGETIVIFTAGLSVLLLLYERK